MRDVDIVLMVDRKYADRIRSDSRARMKKLGLLAGDSYIDISPGSPKFDALEPGAMIPAARQTNVDQLISSGEDLVDNFVQISYSLKNILGRVDRGEGLIGELTTTPETKQRITDTFLTTLNKTTPSSATSKAERVWSDASCTTMPMPPRSPVRSRRAPARCRHSSRICRAV